MAAADVVKIVRSKVKGQGHVVIECTAGVGVQVDMTA